MNKARLGLMVLALAAVGCGATDPHEEEVLSEQLGLGEVACGWLPANHTFSNPSPNSVGPTSATYGSTNCPNQYLVHAPATPVIQKFRVFYQGPIPTPAQMPCNGIWAAATLYAHYPGGLFGKDTETVMAHGWEWEGKCFASSECSSCTSARRLTRTSDGDSERPCSPWRCTEAATWPCSRGT
jgi:hypothetical protein